MQQDGKRVYAIDLARGLAVFFMICIHVLIACGNPTVWHSPYGWVIGFFGSPTAAPVFMMLMGVSFYYSRHTDLKFSIVRGIKIILLGYLLNFLRGVLPVAAADAFSPAAYAGIPEALTDYTESFLELDILQFAGLSLILMAFIRKFNVNKYLLLLFALGIALGSPMLWGIQCGSPLADHFLDYLWGDIPSSEPCLGNLVSFPFFPWFAYVLLGMYFGSIMSKSQDVRKIINRAGLAGILVIVVTGLYFFFFGDFMKDLGDYYHSRGSVTIFQCGVILVWLWLCNAVVERLPMNKVFEVLFYWSRNVNSIYLIQWVLIMWAAVFVTGFDSLYFAGTTVTIAVISLSSHFLNKVYMQLQSPKKN